MSTKWNMRGYTAVSAFKRGSDPATNKIDTSTNCVAVHTVGAKANAAAILGKAAIAALFIGLQMISFVVSAQTYFKCVHPSGKVEFSDKGCAGNSQGSLERQRTNTLDSSAARQQYQLNVQRQEAEKRIATQERVMAVAAPVQGVCPTDRDISNLETKASSITLRDEDRKFLQAEIRRARACRVEGGSYSADDWKQIEESQKSVNRIDSRDRQTGRAKTEGIHSVSASDREKERMIVEKQLDAQRKATEAAERAAQAATPSITPSIITSCDRGGCWDNLGGRYNGSGGNFVRSDGRSCQSFGGVMRCN